MYNYRDDRKTLRTECLCGDQTDHVVLFTYYEDDFNDFYISTTLHNHRGWRQRFVLAFKYLFKIGKENYYYTEQLLNQQDVIVLKDFLDQYLKDNPV